MENARSHHRFGAGLVFGLILIASGVSSLLERARVFEAITQRQWWPLVLVALGVAKLVDASRENRQAAWLFLVIGGWGSLVSLTSLTVSETWPLLLLVGGAWLIANSHADLLAGEHEEPHVN